MKNAGPYVPSLSTVKPKSEIHQPIIIKALTRLSNIIVYQRPDLSDNYWDNKRVMLAIRDCNGTVHELCVINLKLLHPLPGNPPCI